MVASHKKGRKAKPYMGSVGILRSLVDYVPDTGEMATLPPYPSMGALSYEGYRQIKLPVADVTEQGNRIREYFRCDHLAWMYMTGDWPSGWIEHVNGLRADDAIENLVMVDHNGTRWWYGAQAGTSIRQLVMVDVGDDKNPMNAVGPLTERVEDDDGNVRVIPVVSQGWRMNLKPLPHLDTDPHDEDLTLPKGQFGIDWGVSQGETKSDDDEA